MREQATAPGAGARVARTFTDEDGNRWEVWEVDGAAVPAARGERCLIFRATHAVRRVWTYPRGWADLSADELVALSWGR